MWQPNERWRETYDQWKTASPYDDEEENIGEGEEEVENEVDLIPLPEEE